MKRKIFLIMFLFSCLFLCRAAFAASAPSADDLVHIYNDYLQDDTADNFYRRWHENNNDTGYYYQLRDVTGSYDRHTVAGNQWFAVIRENWFRYIINPSGLGTDYFISWRTLGGEAPTVPITTSADLLHDFDYVYIDEPEPYPSNSPYRDVYMDPLVNLFLVVKEGRGEFNVRFGNHYARHFPYWWDEGNPARTNVIFNTSLNERIYQYDANGIYTLSLPRTTLYTISGDTVYSGDNAAYVISNDRILYASGDVAYTVNTSGGTYFIYDANGNSAYRAYNGYIYYNSRTVREDLNMSLNDYSVRIQPSDAQNVAPSEYLNARFTINANDAQDYGSTMGTLSFRQSAKLDTGYSGWRESSLIPIVVANVHDGPASDAGNELYFDMILKTRSDDIINRIKFRWGVDDDLTQDLGNIFLSSSANTNAPQYDLETRITNRTGTRYRVQRYDRLAWAERFVSPDMGDNLPLHWMFDLPSDGYQSLPAHFYLDSHSQIAPGLVTVYKGGIDMTYGSSRSFRLYPFSASTYKTLTLSYQRIRDVNSTAAHSITSGAGVTSTRGLCFEEGFVDRGYSGTLASQNTSEQLKEIMGLPPVMLTGNVNTSLLNSALTSGVSTYPNIGSRRYYPIQFNVDVDTLITVSHDYVTSYDASGDAVGSIDNGPAEIPLLPVTVRFEIPRGDELLTDANWARLYDTSNAQTLLQRFMQFGTIGVRSPNTDELDVDLLTALDGEISSGAVGSAGLNRYIKAFLVDDKDDTTDDKLVLEFIAFLADAASVTSGKTAYIRTFEDDNIPYILIGDGKQDDKWTLSFFVTPSGGIDPDNNNTNNNTNDDNNNGKSRNSGGGGGGGGCNSLTPVLPLILLAFVALSKKIKFKN